MWLRFYLWGNFIIVKYMLLLWVFLSLGWDGWGLNKLSQFYIGLQFCDWNNNFLTLIKVRKFDSEAIKAKDKSTWGNLSPLGSLPCFSWLQQYQSHKVRLGMVLYSSAFPEDQVSSHWCPGMDLWRSPCYNIITTFPDHSLSKRLFVLWKLPPE